MLTEREDGLYEDGDGRVFQEMVTVDVDLDAAAAARLADLSHRTGLTESQLCEHAIVDQLISAALRAGKDAPEA